MEEASLGIGGMICAAFAILFIVVFFPFSLFSTIKVSARRLPDWSSQPLLSYSLANLRLVLLCADR